MNCYCYEDWDGVSNHYLRTLIKSQVKITGQEIIGALHLGSLKRCCQLEIQCKSYLMLNILVTTC